MRLIIRNTDKLEFSKQISKIIVNIFGNVNIYYYLYCTRLRDKQSYYLHGLDGWDYFEDEPSKKFRKMLKGTTLPIDNHSDENGEYYGDTHSYISPEEFFKLKEAYTKGQLFAGNLKINGVVVPIEVELIGADNKTNQFITNNILFECEIQLNL